MFLLWGTWSNLEQAQGADKACPECLFWTGLRLLGESYFPFLDGSRASPAKRWAEAVEQQSKHWAAMNFPAAGGRIIELYHLLPSRRAASFYTAFYCQEIARNLACWLAVSAAFKTLASPNGTAQARGQGVQTGFRGRNNHRLVKALHRLG